MCGCSSNCVGVLVICGCFGNCVCVLVMCGCFGNEGVLAFVRVFW